MLQVNRGLYVCMLLVYGVLLDCITGLWSSCVCYRLREVYVSVCYWFYLTV